MHYRAGRGWPSLQPRRAASPFPRFAWRLTRDYIESWPITLSGLMLITCNELDSFRICALLYFAFDPSKLLFWDEFSSKWRKFFNDEWSNARAKFQVFIRRDRINYFLLGEKRGEKVSRYFWTNAAHSVSKVYRSVLPPI